MRNIFCKKISFVGQRGTKNKKILFKATEKSYILKVKEQKALFIRLLALRVLPGRVGLLRVEKLSLSLSVFEEISVHVLQVLALKPKRRRRFKKPALKNNAGKIFQRNFAENIEAVSICSGLIMPQHICTISDFQIK